MKILPPPHNKGQQTATGSGEIISSTGGLIQSVNILPETGKPAELHKVPGSVVTSSVRILPLSAPATSAADAGNTVALISAEGPPKPLVSSQAATFTTRSAHQRDFIRLAFCERSLIWLGDKFVSRHRGGYYSFRLLPATQLISVSDQNRNFLPVLLLLCFQNFKLTRTLSSVSGYTVKYLHLDCVYVETRLFSTGP